MNVTINLCIAVVLLGAIMLGMTSCGIPASSQNDAAAQQPLKKEVVVSFIAAPAEAIKPDAGYMVIFRNGQTAFALGDYDHLLRSTDNGRSWQMLIPAPEDEKEFGGKFKDMVVFFRFVTPTRGWLSARRGVWQTDDGGDTWRLIFPNRWKVIDFADKQHGWLSLYIDDNSIQSYVTQDGGETWQTCGSASDGQIPESTYFLSPQLGWGIIRYVDGDEVNGVAHTADGGCHWQQLWVSDDNPDERYNAIYFLNEREGWLAGETRLYHTTDGGKTWRGIWSPNDRLQITDLYFDNSKNGWIIAAIMGVEDTGVYRTTDGGKTWQKLKRSEIMSGELPAGWEAGRLLQMLYDAGATNQRSR